MAVMAVKASGLVTAVGLDAPATLAALRAHVSGVDTANLWDAESASYIQAARAPLKQWWEGAGKLIELLAPAVQECLTAAGTSPDKVPLLIGTPSPDRPHKWADFDKQVLAQVGKKLGVSWHPASAVLPRGNVSGIIGLQMAGNLLLDKSIPGAIVAGIDSFLEQKIVVAYGNHRRILTPANSNGFIPGEAGAAILLTRGNSPGSSGELQILGTGLAKEKATINSEKPLRGDGLIEAVQQALTESGLPLHEIDYRITDLNGEHYKFKEANWVVARLFKKQRQRIFELWHPVDCIGEIGAASGPCVLAWALHAGQRGYAPGPAVLCHFSNDDEERAAAVVRFVPGGGP
jgi:3-oxoacyl-[acyl-carrier-protein] synthase-1